jgi:hypothetical protein
MSRCKLRLFNPSFREAPEDGVPWGFPSFPVSPAYVTQEAPWQLAAVSLQPLEDSRHWVAGEMGVFQQPVWKRMQ